jgi:hypothetical protein
MNFNDRPGRARAIMKRLPENLPLIGAEVGVARGLLSAMLLRARPQLVLLMVDLWAPNPSPDYRATKDRNSRFSHRRFAIFYGQARQNTRFARERAKLIQADSVAAAATVAPASLDFVFIDDDHSLSGCTRSIAAWFPKIKPGGWLSGHDYAHTNPQFRFGVTEAVQAFCAPRHLDIETDANFTWFVRVPSE